MLVAIDVAIRGLHILSVTQLFNYDLLNDYQDYFHRIGSTVCAGEHGIQLVLLVKNIL
ncbi:MAG: helicase-related protein [Arsenophonus sp. NC-WZS1-MAG3]